MNDILPDLFTNISENKSRIFKENYIKSVGDFIDLINWINRCILRPTFFRSRRSYETLRKYGSG